MSNFNYSFTDASGNEQGFDAHYETHIRPHIQRFEEKRLAAHALNKARKHWVTPLSVLLATINVACIIVFNWAVDSIWLAGVAAAGLYGYAYWPLKQYKANIKDEIYPLIFKFFGDDFTYNNARNAVNKKASVSALQKLSEFSGFSDHIKTFKPSGILPQYNSVKVDDLVNGIYKHVSIELIEAILKRGGKNKHTIFKGLFIHLTMNKQFNGKTIVQADAGGVGNWLRDKLKTMETVNLEDPRFEKIFEVYSTDQIEARYLLTTSFMERLVELKDLFHGGKGKFQASFYNDKLLLMIPTSDKFKVGSVNVPVSFKHEIDTILKEMSLIFQIIDILKLDQKTGL